MNYDSFAIDGWILGRVKSYFTVSSKNEVLEITELNLNNPDQQDSLDKISFSMRNRLT